MAATVIVETGSGADPDANSYISLADAVSYLENRLYTTEWDNADAEARSQALIMATSTLDANCIFRGYRKLVKQPLAWPRVLAKNDDYWQVGGLPFNVYTTLRYWKENEVPFYVVQATALEALELLRSDRTTDPGTKGVSSLGLGQGALTMTFTGKKSDLPQPMSDEVQKVIMPVVDGFRSGATMARRVVRVQ
jgi:hypothetical protein